ncbi:MAG: serine/threonine protein kinase [Polyangiaceae bacterium]|nr:serine/threonine protein kinase [Polyangiaceae bacterium]
MSDPHTDSETAVEPGRYLSGAVIGGKYRLIRQLGQGGVGQVWVANNQLLDVHVGMKLLYRDEKATGASQVQAERLLQEARAAAKLRHPAIVTIHDFGETDQGDPFVVMELLHGETLTKHLHRQGRVPATRAVELLLPIAEALSVAHAQGVVHRDVKPENIFMTATDGGRLQPKLLDFGIAQVAAETDRKLTVQGTVLGTPDYMSPEQARGEGDVDSRTDVWSFSVVLYELLTGRVPFDEENYNALLWAISNEPPIPTRELAAGDAELWSIIERGLCKERAGRWADMRSLGRALALWLSSHGVVEDVTGTSLRATWLEPAAGAASLETAPASAPVSSPDRTPTLPPDSDADSTEQRGALAAPLTRPKRGRALVSVMAAALLALGAIAVLGLTWSKSSAVEAAPVVVEPAPTTTLESTRPPAPAAPDGAATLATQAPAALALPASSEPQNKAVSPRGRRSKKAASPGTSSSGASKGYDFGF